jgi:hypothetical protein
MHLTVEVWVGLNKPEIKLCVVGDRIVRIVRSSFLDGDYYPAGK